MTKIIIYLLFACSFLLVAILVSRESQDAFMFFIGAGLSFMSIGIVEWANKELES